jgi:hypothetical protein
METFGNIWKQKNATFFRCDSCDYTTIRKYNYEKHILSRKHNLETNGNTFATKSSNQLLDLICYDTSSNNTIMGKKYGLKKTENFATFCSNKIESINYNDKQCIKSSIENNYGVKNTKKNATKSSNTIICDFCSKEFKCRSGLWKHNKKCKEKVENITSSTDTVNLQMLTNLVMEVVKQNKELISVNSDLTTKLVDVRNITHSSINNYTQNNNKTFNLNVFLNETCKDAMNINDFVDSIELQVSDLEDVGKLGFVEGISNIIVKNLKALDIHKRPVHCADKKREIIYVKDENKWEKENDQKIKLRKAIKKIAIKNEKLLPTFKQLHPGCNYSESKYSDQYSKIVIETMSDVNSEKEDKIIKNIAKEIIIDKT